MGYARGIFVPKLAGALSPAGFGFFPNQYSGKRLIEIL